MILVEQLGLFCNELDIANAARVSHGAKHATFEKSDENLIKFLLKNNHKSPFYHAHIQFRIKMPIFVARQWFRHHVGFARNEVSKRYTEEVMGYWFPPSDIWRAANKTNKKKGSDPEETVRSIKCQAIYESALNEANAAYNYLIENGVSREQARAVLPQATFTEFIETGSLWAYINLIKERTTDDAQKEIREYAEMIREHLRKKYPITINFLFPQSPS